MHAEIQAAAASTTTLGNSPDVFDLIPILHADILHRITVSSYSQPKPRWVITSQRINADSLSEAKMDLKQVWCNLPLGCDAWAPDESSQ